MATVMEWASKTALILLTGSSIGCGAAAAPTGTATIPPGPSWSGSNLEARSVAMEWLASAYGTEAAPLLIQVRDETARRPTEIEGFHIMVHPVTQTEYATFVRSTGAPEPWIDRTRWQAQQTGLAYASVERLAWKDGTPSEDRRHHPVVLVDRHDAEDYCQWWGSMHGGLGKLPTEAQWNRAAGGDEGTAFPWGNQHDPTHANTWETGVGDTVPVGASPESVSAFGVHDLAGNVYEWTRTSAGLGHSVIKGGSWANSLVEARTSTSTRAAHDLRHVTVGFRCVFSANKR